MYTLFRKQRHVLFVLITFPHYMACYMENAVQLLHFLLARVTLACMLELIYTLSNWVWSSSFLIVSTILLALYLLMFFNSWLGVCAKSELYNNDLESISTTCDMWRVDSSLWLPPSIFLYRIATDGYCNAFCSGCLKTAQLVIITNTTITSCTCWMIQL